MVLKNKRALITGASSGIGQAIAISLAREGCNIIFTYNKNSKGASQTEKSINKYNVKTTSVKVDLSKKSDIEKLFSQIEKKYEKIDILINNAGINKGGELLDPSFWRMLFEIDLFSIVSCINKSIKFMEKGSKILNITSCYGEEKGGYKGLIAYSAAKAALNSLTRTLAKHLAPNIYVNAVAPGYVDTPLWGNLTDEQKAIEGKDQLIERMIEPEEIANMAVAVLKNDAVNGEVIQVDGGILLKTV